MEGIRQLRGERFLDGTIEKFDRSIVIVVKIIVGHPQHMKVTIAESEEPSLQRRRGRLNPDAGMMKLLAAMQPYMLPNILVSDLYKKSYNVTYILVLIN